MIIAINFIEFIVIKQHITALKLIINLNFSLVIARTHYLVMYCPCHSHFLLRLSKGINGYVRALSFEVIMQLYLITVVLIRDVTIAITIVIVAFNVTVSYFDEQLVKYLIIVITWLVVFASLIVVVIDVIEVIITIVTIAVTISL